TTQYDRLAGPDVKPAHGGDLQHRARVPQRPLPRKIRTSTPFRGGWSRTRSKVDTVGLTYFHGKQCTAAWTLDRPHLGRRRQESHDLDGCRNAHCIDRIRSGTLVCGGISVYRDVSSWADVALVARYSSGDRVNRRRHRGGGRACPQDAPRKRAIAAVGPDD